jgi:hypothetical protein
MGCVGILKDWFTRALAAALERGAPTLTRADLEHYAWSLDQCEKMAQDTLEGESAFIEKPESARRLRELLGLGAMAGAEAAKPVGTAPGTEGRPSDVRRLRRRSRRVGLRRPVRDEVGMRRAS